MGCRHADFTNNHATPQPEAGLRPKDFQALSAFASEAAILLAHSDIDVKSNEIPAAQRMIAEFGLTGVLFTADALHCQKNL